MEGVLKIKESVKFINYIYSAIMLAISLFLFFTFKESNKFIFYFATFLLFASGVVIEWTYSFSDVKPLKLSIILTIIALFIPVLALYILTLLKVNEYNAPIAILLNIAIVNYLVRNLESIKKIFNKYFTKNDEHPNK